VPSKGGGGRGRGEGRENGLMFRGGDPASLSPVDESCTAVSEKKRGGEKKDRDAIASISTPIAFRSGPGGKVEQPLQDVRDRDHA